MSKCKAGPFAKLIESTLIGLAGKVKTEVRFDPVRRWKIDIVIDGMIAIEIDGGGYGKPVRCHKCGSPVMGRKANGTLYRITEALGHHTGKAHAADCEKQNAMVFAGFVVLRYSTSQIKENPGGVLEEIRRMINSIKGNR